MTISSQEIRNSSGSLELADVSKTKLFEQPSSESSSYPNQEVTMKIRDEVLSSVGTQDMDSSEYQVSDLDDVEFYWENDRLDVDADFEPGIDTPLFTNSV